MQLAYENQGYFDTKALFTLHQDNQAHTVEYAYTFVPGDLYHFASIDTSALALDQQAAFARTFTVAPGALADAHLRAAIHQALQSLNLGFPVTPVMVPDPSTHTLKIVLKTSASKTK